jgi:hypothetical protein
MKALAATWVAISILFAGFDAMAQQSWCESVDNQGSFQTLVVAQLAAFVSNEDRHTPPEVTIEIERTLYDAPSEEAAAAIDQAYIAYHYVCGRGRDEDAGNLIQKTVEHLVMIAGYRDDQ